MLPVRRISGEQFLYYGRQACFSCEPAYQLLCSTKIDCYSCGADDHTCDKESCADVKCAQTLVYYVYAYRKEYNACSGGRDVFPECG